MFVRRIYGLLAVLEPYYHPTLGKVEPVIVDRDGSADHVVYIYLPCNGEGELHIDDIHEKIADGVVEMHPLWQLLLDIARCGFPGGLTSQGEKFLFERVREVLGEGMKRPELCWMSVSAPGVGDESFLSCVDLGDYEEVATRFTGRTERRLYFNPDSSVMADDLICLEWESGNPIPFKVDYDDGDLEQMLQEREDMYILYCVKHNIDLDELDGWVYVDGDEDTLDNDDQEWR